MKPKCWIRRSFTYHALMPAAARGLSKWEDEEYLSRLNAKGKKQT